MQHAKAHFGELRGGLIFTLMDVWVLSAGMLKSVNAACWTPIDHEPPMPGVLTVLKESGVVPIAMSRFGEEQLKNATLDPLYVPHAVDTQVFKPHPREAVREGYGVSPDAFLIGMVAANKGRPSRKGFQQAMEAFRIFKEKHSEALLYMHTTADPSVASGVDILAMARSLGIEESVVVPPRYRMMFDPLPSGQMAEVYSSFDVFLNPSMGEGFGVPILEAASCGIPAIVTNFSAMPEVAGDAGWPVGCRPFYTPGNSWQAIPDVEEIVEALELSYGESEADRKARSMKARNHALDYDVKKVMKQFMLPALEEAQGRFAERAPLEPITAAA